MRSILDYMGSDISRIHQMIPHIISEDNHEYIHETKEWGRAKAALDWSVIHQLELVEILGKRVLLPV